MKLLFLSEKDVFFPSKRRETSWKGVHHNDVTCRSEISPRGISQTGALSGTWRYSPSDRLNSLDLVLLVPVKVRGQQGHGKQDALFKDLKTSVWQDSLRVSHLCDVCVCVGGSVPALALCCVFSHLYPGMSKMGLNEVTHTHKKKSYSKNL